MTLHRASRAHVFAKVLVDRLGAAVALVVLSPIIAATALGIRLSMGALHRALHGGTAAAALGAAQHLGMGPGQWTH